MTAGRLVVWLGAEPVGDLDRGRRGDLRFTRRPDSPSLTVAAEGAGPAWPPAFTRAWFEGLLPEEVRRTTAEVEHGVARGDTFGLLAAIGWECAGAVSVLPEGRQPAAGAYRQLTDAEVWERLDAMPRSVAPLDRDLRMSLGGAQDKLLLARLDNHWHLPLDGAVSTHILKPEPERHPGLAVAEAWSLAAASAVTGAAVAHLEAPPGHRPTIIVERYDRGISDGIVSRHHQEDGCQVLGLPPEAKYPRGTGPREASLARIAALLVARAEDVPAELGRLLQQVVVNVALLNTDAHAKNTSVLHTGPRTISLSPLYDVAPTLWFMPTQQRAAMPVGSRWLMTEITRRHLLAEGVSWGIPEGEARLVIAAALESLREGMTEADRRYPAVSAGMRAAVDAQLLRLGQW